MRPTPRPRGTSHYAKPALTQDQLVDRLAERGMTLTDESRVARYIRHLGYYRISPYTIPFQVPGTEHEFRVGTTFDDVLDLYVFDRALRLLVLAAIERIEVAVRSALTDHMSLTYSDPHWYTDPSHFRDRGEHNRFLTSVGDSCASQLIKSAEGRGDNLVFQSALEHYLTTYGSPELPPSWLMIESLTLGSLERVVRNLSNRADKTAVGSSIGINAVLLESWLRTYVRVRNICAHHGRLWNVGLGVYPALPTSPAISWLQDREGVAPHNRKRMYPVLVSLQSVLNTISPHSTWAQRLDTLLRSHPALPLRAMGIPPAWREDIFWSVHLPPA